LGDTKFKTTVAKNLPENTSGVSNALDIAIMELPQDEAIMKKLQAVALPLENYLGKPIAAGTETLAVGPHFDMVRYTTQGIVSDHDRDGVRKNGNQEKMFPMIWTDAGSNEGCFGSPLLGYNWESKQWDVIGMTNNKQNDLMTSAVPMETIQAFLFKRGYHTADAKDEKQMKIVSQVHQRDVAGPDQLRQKKR
jgi:hypothetical protein